MTTQGSWWLPPLVLLLTAAPVLGQQEQGAGQKEKGKDVQAAESKKAKSDESEKKPTAAKASPSDAHDKEKEAAKKVAEKAAQEKEKAEAAKKAEAERKAAVKKAAERKAAEDKARRDKALGWIKTMRWRSIGPSSMGGRIVDLAVDESYPSRFWIATASGGLFKTENNGITFTPQFQFENTISIGDVAVAPTDANIVWVGTGESNARNSVSWGDGVYKSVDGGATWKNMGLKESFQIGRILIHPENPDVVFVSALGRLWGENEERGLYKTTDGGETWKKVLYVDAGVGCIELAMQPGSPDTILAAMYGRKRDPYDGGDPIKRFDWGSGLFKSTDGGESWNRVTTGLPTCKLGRIGLDFVRSKPNVVYAIVESEQIGKAPKGTEAAGADGNSKQPGWFRTDRHHAWRRRGEGRFEDRRHDHGDRRPKDQRLRRPARGDPQTFRRR